MCQRYHLATRNLSHICSAASNATRCQLRPPHHCFHRPDITCGPSWHLQAMGQPSQAHQQAALPDAVEVVAWALYCSVVASPVASARAPPGVSTQVASLAKQQLPVYPVLLLMALQGLPWLTGRAGLGTPTTPPTPPLVPAVCVGASRASV